MFVMSNMCNVWGAHCIQLMKCNIVCRLNAVAWTMCVWKSLLSCKPFLLHKMWVKKSSCEGECDNPFLVQISPVFRQQSTSTNEIQGFEALALLCIIWDCGIKCSCCSGTSEDVWLLIYVRVPFSIISVLPHFFLAFIRLLFSQPV